MGDNFHLAIGAVATAGEKVVVEMEVETAGLRAVEGWKVQAAREAAAKVEEGMEEEMAVGWAAARVAAKAVAAKAVVEMAMVEMVVVEKAVVATVVATAVAARAAAARVAALAAMAAMVVTEASRAALRAAV